MDQSSYDSQVRFSVPVNNSGKIFLDQRRRGGATAFVSAESRWAIVSTSLAALVAGSIAWMAAGMMAQSHPMVAPSRSSLPYALFMKLIRASEPTTQATLGDNSVNSPAGVEMRTITLDAGDTLAGMLEDVGVSAQDAKAVVAAMGKDFDPRGLKVGQSFDLTYAVPTIDATGAANSPQRKTATVLVNNKPVIVPLSADAEDAGSTPENSEPISRLLSLHFSPSIEQDLTVTRTTQGGYSAEMVKKDLQVHHHRAGATIDSSLYMTAMQAGIPADVVAEMSGMFSYKVDFQRDLHPGDSFEIYYDYYYTPEGQPAKIGAINYATMNLGGRKITMYRYQPDPNQPPEYFDARGQSVKGMLMKTPVDGARISSGFGSRFHPILGYTRMHKGVDFAVPTGTPVMAAGAGTIQFMGRASGYGNFVLINHGNGYSTAYGHLSRFAPGMRQGARVRQGQVFAYSGMTGLATGPHLHYEIRIHGTQVNPLTVKIAQGRLLQGAILRAFEQKREEVDSMVARAPLETKVADSSTDLRFAKIK